MQFKKDRMTSAQRMAALFEGRRPDRVALGAMSTGFNTVNAGMTVYDAYADPEKSFAAMQWTTEQYGWDPIPQYAGHTVLGAWDFGGDVRLPRGEYESSLKMKVHPVRVAEDIEKLTLPDPETAGRIPVARRFAELQAAAGLPVFFFSRSPFTMAANITETEQFLRWSMKRPELCMRLLELSIDHIFNVLADWTTRFGAEKLFVWMSSPSESNQLISPRLLKKYALPFHEEYHRRLAKLNIRRFGMHICGDQNMNLPLLAETAPWPHPSVLSFGHEVDLETAAAHFPQDIIFGNIEPVVIQMGTPEKVYALSRTAIEKGKKALGGFILGPGCGLPVHSPPVNVWAMTRAVNDFGWYD